MSLFDLIAGFLVALFCGAVVGVERELGKAEDSGRNPDADPIARALRNPAGIRTHLAVALLGALLETADRSARATPWLAVAGLLAVAHFVTSTYRVRAERTGQYGMTTALTLLCTYVLGVLALAEHRALAAAVAVMLAAILAVKIPLHHFIWKLERREIAAALELGLVALVLLPLLPNDDLGPLRWPWLAQQMRQLGFADAQLAQLAVLNPFKLWLLVVLISGLGFAGYILVRSLGAEKGLTLTGLVGGLVSSTAVTLSMAQQSRAAPRTKDPFVAAVLAACTVMAARVMLIVLALRAELLAYVAPPMLAMLATGGLVAWRKASPGAKAGASRTASPGAEPGAEADQQPEPAAAALRTPFALWPALKLALLFFGVLVVSRLMALLLGGAGLVVSAFLSGLVDVDAITAAIAQQSSASHFAAAAIFTAVATNTLVKAAMIWTLGSKPVGRATAAWLVATLLAGGAALAGACWL